MSVRELDDRSSVTKLDPKGMLRLTEEFPSQCAHALGLVEGVELPTLPNIPDVAVLTGLGGSAAGGDLVRALFECHAGIPFVVNRDYDLPNYAGLGDLLFCSSYSGNTEETLAAYEHGKSSGCKIICLTTGGKLAEMAAEDENPVIRVPSGQPPRTALGFMTMPVIAACQRLDLLPEFDFDAAIALLEECVKRWTVESPAEENDAKRIALALHGKVPILYGLGAWQGAVANRWKGQINENAKNMAFANAFPELNHNEILGWVKAHEQGVSDWAVVYLQDGTESEKIRTRARVTRELIGGNASFHEVTAPGENLLERMLALTLMGDFVSLYLASLNGVDPENIDAINTLKAELAKV
jgi:glucose/mannose-6-phosphate isomerase